METSCEKYGEHPVGCQCKESINHPSHYKGKSLEAIDVINDFNLNFCLGNAIKYIIRAGKKDNREKDLKKAIWYLQRELTHE